jgi:O-antigen/teichoic acid export membrane protein
MSDRLLADYVSANPRAAISGDSPLKDRVVIGTNAAARQGLRTGTDATRRRGDRLQARSVRLLVRRRCVSAWDERIYCHQTAQQRGSGVAIQVRSGARLWPTHFREGLVGMSALQTRSGRLRRVLVASATRKNALIASSAGLVSGLLNAALLALAARDGQTTEIAAYTVVIAALAFVAIAAGGGSPLLYMSGDNEQRRAVRSQWVFVVLPSLTLGAVAISAFYTHFGYRWSALLAAASVAIGNNLAQLQIGDLACQMRFMTSAVVICCTKLPALMLVAGSVPLTTALVVSTAMQFIAMEFVLRHTSWLRWPALFQLSAREAVAAFRMNRQLFTYSLAELYNGRAASVALSVFTAPRVMGCFGTVVSVYQALGGVLSAGLQVSMVARARDRHGLSESTTPNREPEFIAMLGSVVIAVCVMAAAPWMSGNLLRLPIPESADWLRILVATLPFTVICLAVALNLIGNGDYRTATKVPLLAAVLVSPIIVVTVPVFGPLGAAWATLCSQSLTALAVVSILLRRRNSTAKRNRTSRCVNPS